jgi:Barstar (barnase inhibitor)
MNIEKGYFDVDASTAEQIATWCNSNGGRVFRLSGAGSTKGEFFNAVRESLPLDPPLHSNRSWDALADSLWSGLDKIDENSIVILWLAASQLEKYAPDDFAIASSILKDLPESLANPALTIGPTKRLVVLRVI